MYIWYVRFSAGDIKCGNLEFKTRLPVVEDQRFIGMWLNFESLILVYDAK